MPIDVDRNEVQRLMDEGAAVAEVLPKSEFEWAHLPGAIHLPMRQLDQDMAERKLERGAPIVVYCNDFQ